MRRRLQGVSQRMLARTLRSLECSGLIARSATTSKRLAFEYSLTQPGKTIIAPLRGMCRWAKRYRVDGSAGIHLKEVQARRILASPAAAIAVVRTNRNNQEDDMNIENGVVLITGPP